MYKFIYLNSEEPTSGEEKPNEEIKPIIQIEGLKGWILCMNILDNYLYTGGDDRKIKVWDIKNKSFIFFLIISDPDRRVLRS